MSNQTCRACLEPLEKNIRDNLHSKCYQQLFSKQEVSLKLPYRKRDVIEEVRTKSLRMSLTGGQPKASMGIVKGELRILDRGGQYILKPSTDIHPYISENEHLCMNIARKAKLTVPPFCLVEFSDGELAFLIKRFDRKKKEKIHIEDLCSVLSEYSDDKYKRSYLEIGQAILKQCKDPGFEVLEFFKATVLNYLLGNNDLHLKNFSLIESGDSYSLSPQYDIVCSTLYYPHNDDLCLELLPDYLGSLQTLGFYTKDDFYELGTALSLNSAQIKNIFEALIKIKPSIEQLLTNSHLPSEDREKVSVIINDRYKKFSGAIC